MRTVVCLLKSVISDLLYFDIGCGWFDRQFSAGSKGKVGGTSNASLRIVPCSPQEFSSS